MCFKPSRYRNLRVCVGLKILVPILVLIYLLLRIFLRSPPQEVELPPGVNLYRYRPFEPDVHNDLNYGTDGTQKIQRIIHQTWKNDRIPPQFVENVKTFIENNPTWQYYLWTDDSARELIKDYYPWLLPVWDGLMYSKFTIRRADALRYVVLYHYGGIYADLDAVCYRSLENAITKHPCVFTPEPYEHAVTRAWIPYLINNAVMMCTAKHPFTKQLMENLHTTEQFTGVIDATGPGYVTSQYMLYNDSPKEDYHLILYGNRSTNDPIDSRPYFYQGEIPLSNTSSIYIANSRYFIHSLDLNAFDPIYKMCLQFNDLNFLQQRTCANAKRLGLSRKTHKYAFVDHQWRLTWIWWKKLFKWFNFLFEEEHIPIRDIVPHCKIYTSPNK